MLRTWKRVTALAVAVLCSLAVAADLQAGHHRRGGSCGSSGGGGGGYAYSGGYGGGYAYAGDYNQSDQGNYTGGWTYVQQPTYRRGPFGRRIFVGNQMVAVPAGTEAAGQTAARTETGEMDRTARAPGARTQTESDRSGQGTEFRGGARVTAPSSRDEDAVPPPPTRTESPRSTTPEENAVPPRPRGNAPTPQGSRDENAIPPPPNAAPAIP